MDMETTTRLYHNTASPSIWYKRLAHNHLIRYDCQHDTYDELIVEEGALAFFLRSESIELLKFNPGTDPISKYLERHTRCGKTKHQSAYFTE